MYPGTTSELTPDKPAVIMAESGRTITHLELDQRSNRLAHLLRASGLHHGDHLAVFVENDERYFEIMWAALRSGLFVTPVNRYLKADEAAYIVDDCGARVVITSSHLEDVAVDLVDLCPKVERWLMIDGTTEGFESYEAEVAPMPTEPVTDERLGEVMYYSSGTTGRPKGITRRLSDRPVDRGPALAAVLRNLYDFSAETTYLSPAPIYHAAPLGFCLATQALGGSVVMMEHFEPRAALEAIQRYAVTHSQWVPTMFVRMLKLEETRSRFHSSTHRVAIHGAAPCPRPIKEAMIEWWGPILHEYYGGSEQNGLTTCDSDEWLAHPGTVGKPRFCSVHICDETGAEVPTGDTGLIYFEWPASQFTYHHDDEQTKATRHPSEATWTTLNDIGYVDGDGFLYLTDRQSFMIISGGINIYPREVEDVLVTHPAVLDVAVIGVPNDDFGEEVKAIVELTPAAEPTAELATELRELAAQHLAAYKVPRSVDFIDELPRLPTGKLYKRELRSRYWAERGSNLV